MSAVTSECFATRSIRPTPVERGMLWFATALEAHVARRLERRVEHAHRAALADRSGIGAREEHLMRAHSLNLRLH
jgi:hypothetical protein